MNQRHWWALEDFFTGQLVPNTGTMLPNTGTMLVIGIVSDFTTGTNIHILYLLKRKA